ncbi:MAG: pyridoxal phosphate-dependent aminotransferase [Halanaeroarchaeum sp.]
MFPRLSYLEWMSRRADAALFDLGTTGLVGDRGDERAIVPEPLAELPDAPAGATLENLLAQIYGVDPDRVLVTAGATHATFLAVAASLDETDGDHVAVERPAYEPLVGTPMGLGATVDQFDRGARGGLDVASLRETLGDDTALAIVTNRHNPTGYLADEAELSAAAEAARTVDAPLLVDEVYAPYVTDPVDGPFGGPTAADLPNGVVTGSLTKFFGLGDLRIGWMVGPSDLVGRARQIAFHLPDVAGPSRILARRALVSRDELVDEQRAILAENHRALAEFVASRDDLAGTVHDGASFGFLEPRNSSVDDLVPAAWNEGVLVVPGRFFGDRERVRIAAGRAPTDVTISLRRLGQVLTDVGRAP